MSPESTLVMIAAMEARSAVERLPDDAPLEDRLLAAMKSTRGSWLSLREVERLTAACEGTAQTLERDGEDFARLLGSMESLNRVSALLSALQAGVPVDVEQMAEQVADRTEPEKPIRLLELWRQTDQEEAR